MASLNHSGILHEFGKINYETINIQNLFPVGPQSFDLMTVCIGMLLYVDSNYKIPYLQKF